MTGTPLEQWGEEFRGSIRQAFLRLNEALAKIRADSAARRAALTPEQRDQRSQARYRAAVAAERRKGRYYVDVLIHRAEQDLLRQGIDVRKP